MVAWLVELFQFGIQYQPRKHIKSQVLSDFCVELSSLQNLEPNPWILFVDGASNIKRSRAGVILEWANGLILEQSLCFNFKETNNQVEYEALIASLSLAKEIGVSGLIAKGDSQLVTNQIKGEFQTKEPQLSRYLHKVRTLVQSLNYFQIEYIPREQNAQADLLSKLANTKKPGSNQSVI